MLTATKVPLTTISSWRQRPSVYTVMFLRFWMDRSGQIVQTQIRLLLEEQSDQGLHCLQFSLHLLGALLFGIAILFNFKVDYIKFSSVQNFRIFTVVLSGFEDQINNLEHVE